MYNKEVETVENLYRELKKISSNFYSRGRKIEEFNRFKRYVVNYEQNMKLDYICDTSIENKNIEKFNSTSTFSKYELIYKTDKILDYIVDYSRKFMLPAQMKDSYDQFDVTNKCMLAAFSVSHVCDKLGLYCDRIVIEPAYTTKINLYKGSGYHYFNIVHILDKKYIIDCTYKQFFKTDRGSLERLGIPHLSPPYPGVFMLLDDERKNVAEIMLKQGWIEATDENLKHYFDGFTLSFRNGLYYEKFGLHYDTDYTTYNYMKFIDGTDSLLNHESIKFLGRQKRPLKDYQLNFKIK